MIGSKLATKLATAATQRTPKVTKLESLLSRHGVEIRRQANKGRTSAQIARSLGQHEYLVNKARHVLDCVSRTGGSSKSLRNEKVIALRRTGISYGKIGSELGITRQRVQQIIARDAKNLLGNLPREPKKPDHYCPVCRKPIYGKRNKSCSIKCTKIQRLSDTFARNEKLINEVVNQRLEGKAWKTTGISVGKCWPYCHILVRKHIWRLGLTDAEVSLVFPTVAKRQTNDKRNSGNFI